MLRISCCIWSGSCVPGTLSSMMCSLILRPGQGIENQEPDAAIGEHRAPGHGVQPVVHHQDVAVDRVGRFHPLQVHVVRQRRRGLILPTQRAVAQVEAVNEPVRRPEVHQPLVDGGRRIDPPAGDEPPDRLAGRRPRRRTGPDCPCRPRALSGRQSPAESAGRGVWPTTSTWLGALIPATSPLRATSHR